MLSIIMKSISTGPPAPMSIIDSPGTDVENRREEAERERERKKKSASKQTPHSAAGIAAIQPKTTFNWLN